MTIFHDDDDDFQALNRVFLGLNFKKDLKISKNFFEKIKGVVHSVQIFFC